LRPKISKNDPNWPNYSLNGKIRLNLATIENLQNSRKIVKFLTAGIEISHSDRKSSSSTFWQMSFPVFQLVLRTAVKFVKALTACLFGWFIAYFAKEVLIVTFAHFCLI
jgi:hypothetical protein